MSPAFSQDFLKRLSAFSKLSSGSTITLVTRDSPLSEIPEAPSCIPCPSGGRNLGHGTVVSQFESSLPPGANLLKPDGMTEIIERETWLERITIPILCWSSAADGAGMIWAPAGHENLRRLARHHVPRD